MPTQGHFEQREVGHNSSQKCGGLLKIETEEQSFCCRFSSKIPGENYNSNFCVCSCI